MPKPLLYKAKKQTPATVRQIKYLREYAAHYQIKLPENFPEMTRSEASRLTDRLIATYGTVSYTHLDVYKRQGINGFTMFLRTITYNYYAILAMVMSLFLIFSGLDYGPMKKHEDNALLGDLFTTDDLSLIHI